MAFESTRFIPIVVSDLTPAARGMIEHFRSEGYDVDGTPSASGDWRISLRKGDAFKVVLGMKTALNIDLHLTPAGVLAKAGVGIFGLQAIPTAITLLVFWPVALAQIWGIVQQSKLDGEAMAVVEQQLALHGRPAPTSAGAAASAGASKTTGAGFCPNCGAKLQPPGPFCAACGTRVGSGS